LAILSQLTGNIQVAGGVVPDGSAIDGPAPCAHAIDRCEFEKAPELPVA
jgi:hypothetical protein